MAHTYNTKANIARRNSAYSGSYTCGSGATLLLLTICVGGTTGRTGGAPTYNGIALTQVGSNLVGSSTVLEMWYMLNPPCVDVIDLEIPDGNSVYYTAEISSYKSATGFSALRASGTAGPTTSTNPTGPTHTGLASGDVIIALVGSAHGTWAPSGQTGTSLYTVDNGTYGNAAQYYIKVDVNDQALAWTFANSASWEIISAVFQEESSAKCWIGGAGAQLIYGEEAQIGGAGIQIVYGGDSGIAGVGLQVVYLEAITEIIYRRKFPVPPIERMLQSQDNKRIFPILT